MLEQFKPEMINDERSLWKIGAIECVMVTCCAGAERSGDRIVLRELYPAKSGSGSV